jgi:hypothetical protein
VEERRGGRAGKERALRQALRSIATAPDPIRQAYLIQEAAELFGIGLGILEREVAALAQGGARPGGGRAPGAAGETGAGAGGVGNGEVPAGSRDAVGGQERRPAGPWLDRGEIERSLFAHALRDVSGAAAALLLELRGGRPCATAEGDRLMADLTAWREHRLAGGEQAPAQWVQAGWYEAGNADYRTYVAGLLEHALVPEQADFLKAVRDIHARLETADAQARRRAEAAARLDAAGRDHDGQ